MVAFMGTALACALLSVWLWVGNAPGRGYALAGSLLYIVGTILVTMAFNVPRNNALAGVDPASAEGARRWADYLISWTAWNHVRTAAALTAGALLTLALCALNS
jgi:uncharacterized membrane protein